MEINGIFVNFLPEQSGESARGPWVRGGFVIQTKGEYPKNIAMTVFGEDKLNMIKAFKQGDDVMATFSVESREYPAGSNKWFSDVRCIRLQHTGGAMPQETNNYGIIQSSQPNAAAAAPQTTYSAPVSGGSDDLPF